VVFRRPAFVPSVDPAAVGRNFFVQGVFGHGAGMGERLAEGVAVRMRIVEVARRLDHFIPDQGIKMAELDLEVAVGDFSVELGDGGAVVASAVPPIVPSSIAETLGVGRINAEEIIDPSAPVPVASLGVGFALGENP